MKLNKRKTKNVCSGIARTKQKRSTGIDGEQLEEMEVYTYLRRPLTPDSEMSK